MRSTVDCTVSQKGEGSKGLHRDESGVLIPAGLLGACRETCETATSAEGGGNVQPVPD